MNNGKPENRQELQQDIDNHPERGRVNGEEITRFDSETFQLTIPKELYRVLLEIGGSMGLTKRDIFLTALTRFVSDAGNIALLERWQAMKAEKHNISVAEVKSKVLGAYKRVGREKANRISRNQVETEGEILDTVPVKCLTER